MERRPGALCASGSRSTPFLPLGVGMRICFLSFTGCTTIRRLKRARRSGNRSVLILASTSCSNLRYMQIKHDPSQSCSSKDVIRRFAVLCFNL